MLLTFVTAVLMVINPRILLWTLRHSGHVAGDIKIDRKTSEDYRYVTMTCPCGKQIKCRLRGVNSIADMVDEMMYGKKK